MFDWLDRARGYKDELPNKFSIAMGELIRQARIEAKMSQAELAEKAYFRQAAISQIETGKRDVTASEVVYLSYTLNKPITYFYPTHIFNVYTEDGELSILEQELLMQAKRLEPDDLKRLIAQARALADYSGKKTIEDYKAISLNVMHSSMEITDQFYSVLNDSQVHERISSIGKASQPSNIREKDTLALFQQFLSWIESQKPENQ